MIMLVNKQNKCMPNNHEGLSNNTNKDEALLGLADASYSICIALAQLTHEMGDTDKILEMQSTLKTINQAIEDRVTNTLEKKRTAFCDVSDNQDIAEFLCQEKESDPNFENNLSAAIEGILTAVQAIDKLNKTLGYDCSTISLEDAMDTIENMIYTIHLSQLDPGK